jgi:hypothetical protein
MEKQHITRCDILGFSSFLAAVIFSAKRVKQLGHLHTGTAGTRESLNSHDLKVEIAISKSMLCPIVEMVANSNSTGSTLALANRPVLRERARPRDRWLIGSSVGANGISAAVRFYSAEICCAGARVVRAIRFDDVVLGLGRVDPAVDSEVGARA